jgi:Tfp pilus assembly protein PilF
MENYEIALNIKSDYPLPLLNMGYIYEDKGDFESASKMYNNAISVSSKKFAPAYNALARLYIMGKLKKGDLNQDRDTLEAIKLLDTAWRLPVEKKLDKDYLEDYEGQKSLMLKNLGWANLKLRHYSEAEVFLNRAIELDINRASSYCILAMVAEEKSKADDRKNAKQLALEAWKSCKEKAEDDNPDEMKWKQMAEERLNKNANNKDN